ncbi:hypothetical protein HJFPF1_10248 [Paramyrothecium foliicola]|nr:hypothetical protein HJFPF1_10248 [Paramyrothecium foliicola]
MTLQQQFSGRGRGRGGYGTSFNARRGGRRANTPPDPLPPAPLGPIVRSLTMDELDKMAVHGFNDNITACRVLASYNWLEKQVPTIALPGMPPRWNPPAGPQQLKEDSGIYYRDLNAAKYPKHSMESAITAILETNVGNTNQINVFGCGSTLGNLLRFVQGTSKSFRFLIEMIGPTIHFIRRERSPSETIPDIRGHGHTFPEAYTTWDPSVAASSSHQRIIQYSLGGLEFAVRFEADGYLSDKMGKAGATKSPSQKTPDNGVAGSSDGVDLVEQLAMLLGAPHTASSEATQPLQVSSAGIPVAQSSIFDLKTRMSRKKPLEETMIAGEIPRLWLRQIPNFILAYHHFGLFKDIQIRDVQRDIAHWETSNVNHIRNLVALIRILRETAKMRDDGKLEVTYEEGEEQLVLRGQLSDAPEPLSENLRQRWKEWLNNQPCSDDDDSVPRKDIELKAMLEAAKSNKQYDSDSSFDYDEMYYGGSEPKDFTACDKECGYCGHCDY